MLDEAQLSNGRPYWYVAEKNYFNMPEEISDCTFPHIDFCVPKYYEEYSKNKQL